MSQTGKLYGVGVGPGDPGLLTLRAAAVIRDCPVLAVPVSGGERQLALEIARQAVPEAAERSCCGWTSPWSTTGPAFAKATTRPPPG